jgi:hypothetical protein
VTAPGPGAVTWQDDGAPVEWPSLEAYWMDDLRRWHSMEADYGVHWHRGAQQWPAWRVSYGEATGELFAVRAVPSGGRNPAPGVLLLATVPPDPVPCQRCAEPAAAHYPAVRPARPHPDHPAGHPFRETGLWYATLERLLDGWADPGTGWDLAWFGRRLAARGVTTVVDHAW